MDNIIRIGSAKGITPYFESILLRGQPKVYNKYNCIKLRFTKNVWKDVYYLLCMFWHFGIYCDEITRMKGGLPVDKGVIIDEFYEATLKKIGAIMFDNNEDYAERMNNLWENRK
jgi:hypothetical protein